jgi:hypothetical protein
VRSPLERAFDRIAARLFGPLDTYPEPKLHYSPRSRAGDEPILLDLIDRPPGDGPLVYSDRERTGDEQPTVELLLYRYDPVPITLRMYLR